ncbi:MAG: HEAT repeat domain-containing protein [Anaerolineae bacterium]|jgi:HEAT repeat protein|nr:HEAT repeat domain-containing protein [Anaerolineae bacterium]MBT7073783.1 HEAT repeat domain-containing protein [Anaerolineae bacterium]MBT7783103.1 HEAT repeat domain-containing protein [Anaerolineae bacterium]
MAWLSDKKEEATIKQLLRTLNDSRLKNRNQAARELLIIGEAGAENLVATLSSSAPQQREMVSRILIQLGRKAIPALNIAMQNTSSSVQQEIIHVFQEMKNQEALESLFRSTKSKDYKIQILSAKALQKIGDAQAIPYLLIILNDEDPDVRVASVTALGSFREPETYANITDLLDDTEINVRIAAVKAIGKIKDVSTIPYLVEALYDSFWWYGREEATETLLEAISSFGKAAIDELKEAMNAKEPTVRRYAIELLRPLRDIRVMDALQMAFYDTNYDVAESALKAILDFGETALPILSEALISPNIWIREKAVEGLAEIGGEEATINLLEMLSDEEISVRKATIGSLSKLKDPRALPTLRAISQKRENKEIAKLARQAIVAIEAP